jgi:hypothetical protein
MYHCAQQLAGRLKNFHPSTRIEYPGKLAADIGLERLQGATAVEIGTGWVPVMPIALKLLGVSTLYSFDLTRHLQKMITMRSLAKFDEVLAELARRSGASLAVLQSQFAQLKDAPTFDNLARRMDFHYHAPMDFTQFPIRAKSVDLIYSNLVLEHVAPDALRKILKRSRDILKPGGVCWHNVDYTDHYAATHPGMCRRLTSCATARDSGTPSARTTSCTKIASEGQTTPRPLWRRDLRSCTPSITFWKTKSSLKKSRWLPSFRAGPRQTF